jgi:hypothetical protein
LPPPLLVEPPLLLLLLPPVLLLLVLPPPLLLLLLLPLPLLDAVPPDPHTPPRGTHTLTSCPLAVATGVHASLAEHSLPLGHAVAQYVSPPSCEQTPPLQSLFVRHATQVPPPAPLLDVLPLPLLAMPFEPPSVQAPSSVTLVPEHAASAAREPRTQRPATRETWVPMLCRVAFPAGRRNVTKRQTHVSDGCVEKMGAPGKKLRLPRTSPPVHAIRSCGVRSDQQPPLGNLQ